MALNSLNKLLLAIVTLLCLTLANAFDKEKMDDVLNGEVLPQDYADKFTRIMIKYNFNSPECQPAPGRRILTSDDAQTTRSALLNSVVADLVNDLEAGVTPVINEHRNELTAQAEESDLKMRFSFTAKHDLDSLTINRPMPDEATDDPIPLQTVLEKLSNTPCVEGVGLQPRINPISSRPSENVRAASKTNLKETKTPATVEQKRHSVYTYPNDPFHIQQWWYLARGEAEQHYPAFGGDFVLPNLQEVHQIWNGNGTDYKIGVLDTGLDVFHPDMLIDGEVESFEEIKGTDSQYYFNEAEADGNSIRSGNIGTCFDDSDTDMNGFRDDCFGIDFLGWPMPLDFAGHGTHVAGIIAARTNNNKHVSSACPDCKVVPMAPLFPIEGIIYALETKIPVMNWSFGFYRKALYCTDSYFFCPFIKFYLFMLEVFIETYRDAGGIIVVSAGNEPTNLDDCLSISQNDPFVCQRENYFFGYPCQLSVKYNNIICVGASDHFGKMAKFSTFGKESVTVFAPGVDMLSLGVTYFFETQANYQGTSMAAPVVSGIIGLIRSQYPLLTVDQIHKIMRVSCQKTKFLQSRSVCGGVIDAVKAMAHASVCNQTPSQCGMPLSLGTDEESHESVVSWFCQKAASFGHSYVPFCH